MKALIKKKSKGQVLVLVAVSLVVLLALTALAIDVGIAYTVQSKLNSAVDGAAIAASRGVKQGSSLGERKANGRAAALRFFAANFPANFMGSVLTSGTPTIDIPDPVNGTWTITVNGRARAPIFFARAVGWPSLTVKALAESKVRDLDLVIVLDCSGSLGPPTSSSSTFPSLKQAAINFINRFSDGNGGDRIGVVAFASGAASASWDGYVAINTDGTRGFDKSTVINAINALTVGGSTASGESMRKAKAELDRVPVQYRSSLRVIVFFSDGAPNDVAGSFSSGHNNFIGTLYSETPDSLTVCGGATGRADRTFHYDRRNYPDGGDTHGCNITYLPSTDYTGTVALESYNGRRTLKYEGNSGRIENTKCNVNRAARNMVENTANSARSGFGNDAITVYTLGLGYRLRTLEIPSSMCPGYGNEEWGENILKRLANTADSDTHNSSQPTGMYVFASDETQLDAAFQTIANQILRLTK
ncbi:MAG: VWA domain-containing protein [Geobacteraceae bacterium]|nr:VWA domain-containing protein [Geobacteraceae bacterium]